jgi:hypothetical protein
MNDKSSWNYGSRILLLSISAFLAFAAPSQAKYAASSQPKHSPPKTAKAASKPRPAPNPEHDLLIRLEDNQKALQRQLQTLSAASERREDEANRGMIGLADQLRQQSAQKDSDYSQLLTMVQSTRRLSRLVTLLLLLLGGAVFFVGLQLRKSGLLQFERRTIARVQPAPDSGIEPRWKVGL